MEIPKKPRYRTPHIYDDNKLSSLAKSLKRWTQGLIQNREFGLLGDWCFDHNFNPKYFKRYADKHEEFQEAYLFAKAWQEHIVARQALLGSLNPKFAQFFMGCAHDWRTRDANEEKMNQLTDSFSEYLRIAKEEKKKELEEKEIEEEE